MQKIFKASIQDLSISFLRPFSLPSTRCSRTKLMSFFRVAIFYSFAPIRNWHLLFSSFLGNAEVKTVRSRVVSRGVERHTLMLDPGEITTCMQDSSLIEDWYHFEISECP